MPVAVLVATLSAGVVSAGQQATPAPSPPAVTFRAGVDYVELDAFVTDRKGDIVKDLTRDDFEIREDGKPQAISTFSLVDLPLQHEVRPRGAGNAVDPDVQSNDHLDGRFYLIVLDDLNTDPSRTRRVRDMMRRFIEQDFGEHDVAAVVFTGGRSIDAQDFTSSPRRLLAAIDAFVGQRLPSAEIERARSGGQASGAAGGNEDAPERARRAQVTMATIRRLAEFMGHVQGRRKAMLLVSEGIDYDITNLIGADPRGHGGLPSDSDPAAATIVFDETRDALAAATRSNVNIYAIDPRGLKTGTEDLVQSSSVRTGPNGQDLSMKALLDEQQRARDSLRELAETTGGFAAVNTNDLGRALDRVARENSTYYLIGYNSTNDAHDGRFRTIEVRLKRPGLRVRSRKGYVAPRANTPAAPRSPEAISPAIAEALGSPLPVGGVPMRMYAAAFKASQRIAAIPLVVELDVSALHFAEKDGTFDDTVDVLYSAIDAHSTVAATDRHTVKLALKPATYERLKAGGLRVVTQLDLTPGRYQIRVAAGDATGAGSVIDDVDVPEFSKGMLSMSGLALTSQAASETVTVTAKNPLRDVLATPLTATRDFRAADVVTVFGEVYDAITDPATHDVKITTELRDAAGRVLFATSEQRSSTEGQSAGGSYRFSARIPLTGIAPGPCVIHVVASASPGGPPTVIRDVPIRILRP